jgi:hypothetical protein
MSGAVHPFRQYAFMAWCSVKKKITGTTLPLLLPLIIFDAGLQIWSAATNILNKQSRTADVGGPPASKLGKGLRTPHRNKILLLNIT